MGGKTPMPNPLMPSANQPIMAVAKRKSLGKKLALGLVFLALVGALSYEIVTIYSTNSTKPELPAKVALATRPAQKPSVAPSTQASVSHIFIIMMENQPATNIIGSTAAPYLNSLMAHYALATNYSGVTHPSLPNYIALTSGSTDGITTDCNPPGAGCIVSVPNIADEIEASGRSWKAYAESMPSPCYAVNSLPNYATKHVPFLYYADIINNPARCNAHVVPFTELSSDLQSVATTPNFAFITPNLCNDMHSCPISSGDTWLAQNVPIILNSPAFSTTPSLLVITWDEGYSSDNTVATIFAGSAAKANFRSNNPYSHYALLHTIEYLWGLKPLTANDQNAPIMNDLISIH